jgi:hypothetical protein
MMKLVTLYTLSILLLSFAVPVVLSNEYDATRAAACDDFNRASGTVVTGWTEQFGDWAIYTNRLMSEYPSDFWQYITFDGSDQHDGCVEAIVQYGEGSGVRFMGLTARWTDADDNIVFKIQDNNNSGYWDSYFLYDAGTNKYYQDGLNLGLEVKIQMEYIGSSVEFRIDTDMDGTWDIEHMVGGFTVTGPGLTGATAYKQCFLDNWCYGSYCNEWNPVICPPEGIPEGEPVCGDEYDDEYNGGCNSDPYVFQDIYCGDIICGESGNYMYSGSNYRDTDWFRLEVDSVTTVTWSVIAEFSSQILILDAQSENCLDYLVIQSSFAAEFEINEISAMVDAGVYWLWVGPDVFSGYPCGVEYVATLSCEPLYTPTPVPTSTPTRTPTPVNTPTPDCIHNGDVNLDGVISAADAQMAFYIVLGLHVPTYEEECAADCNGDDIVSAADAQAIFLVVLGSGNCVDPL